MGTRLSDHIEESIEEIVLMSSDSDCVVSVGEKCLTRHYYKVELMKLSSQ